MPYLKENIALFMLFFYCFLSELALPHLSVRFKGQKKGVKIVFACSLANSVFSDDTIVICQTFSIRISFAISFSGMIGVSVECKGYKRSIQFFTTCSVANSVFSNAIIVNHLLYRSICTLLLTIDESL